MASPRASSETSAAFAILVMRLTLGVFLLLWSVEKFVVPGSTVRIAQHFYGIALPEVAAPVIGLAELALSLALLAGFAQQVVYGLAVIVHGSSTLATWRQLLDPFGLANIGNHLFIAGVPVLGAFIALYLLRTFDLYSADEWLAARRQRHLSATAPH